MLKVSKINNDIITIKIINNKKVILKDLGIKNKTNNQFDIFKTPTNIQILLKYTNNPTLALIGEQLWHNYTMLEQQKKLNDYPGNTRLRPYQRVDVAILKQHPRFGLFNEMRTGKTPTILTTLMELKVNKVLFVVPKSTILLTWIPEIKNWTNYNFIMIKDDIMKIRKQKYQQFAISTNCALIISKDMFKNDVNNKLITNFDFTLVIDEAHFLRNYNTVQTTAILTMANQVSSVYCLTGTPANNHPSDIFGMLKVIDNKMYQHTDYWDFVDRYFGIIRKRITNYVTINIAKTQVKPLMKAEFDYLVKKVSIMRKQIDIRSKMPLIITNDVILPMPTKQALIYQQTLAQMKQELFFNPTSITFLQIFTKLRTICSTPINEGIKELGAKFNWVLEYLQDNNDDHIIIYSCFSAKGINILSNILHKNNIKHELITGKVNIQQRQIAVTNFQNGLVNIILCNIKTANVGVTLDRANVIIVLDHELNPTENEQAISRFFPTQLHDNKTRQIIKLYCQNTIDLKIKTILNQKININKIINDQGIKFFE